MGRDGEQIDGLPDIMEVEFDLCCVHNPGGRLDIQQEDCVYGLAEPGFRVRQLGVYYTILKVVAVPNGKILRA